MQDALQRINGDLPASILDDVLKQVVRLDSTVIAENSLAFHAMLINGVGVQVRGDDGTCGTRVWFIDFDDTANNASFMVNQLAGRWPLMRCRAS